VSFGNDRRKMGVRRSVRMSVSKIPASPKDYPDEMSHDFGSEAPDRQARRIPG
jgi:hypothetical protein